MKKMAYISLIMIILLVVVFAGCAKKVPEGALASMTTKTVPVMDGMVDEVWDDAPALVVDVYVPEYPVFDSSYFKDSYNVSMQSLHTDSDIYFLYQWTGDKEESQARQSWYYNAEEGQWMQKPKYKDDGYYGPEYEDKFAVIWEIGDSIDGFAENGCAILCHGEKKATNAEGETADIWHWKSDRTGPVNQIDDKWLGYSDGNGRHGDDGTGAYSSNSQELTDAAGNTMKAPVYWVPGATDYHWIMDGDKNARKIVSVDEDGNLVDEDGTVLVKEDFNGESNIQIPSIYNIKPGIGGRGDVTEYHNYDKATGTWTLEVKRAKNTGDEHDVNFTDPEREYYFSIAVFDAAAIAHAIPGGMSGTAYPLVMR